MSSLFHLVSAGLVFAPPLVFFCGVTRLFKTPLTREFFSCVPSLLVLEEVALSDHRRGRDFEAGPLSWQDERVLLAALQLFTFRAGVADVLVTAAEVDFVGDDLCWSIVWLSLV